MNKIGILVVAYNAESTIESTLNRIPQEFVSEIYSILISDDRSKDLTSARAYGQQSLMLKVVLVVKVEVK